MTEVETYNAIIRCWHCPFKQGTESRQFQIKLKDDWWHYARGQKPRKWYVDEEGELYFYDSEGNSTDPDKSLVGVIYGLCPKCNEELKDED